MRVPLARQLGRPVGRQRFRQRALVHRGSGVTDERAAGGRLHHPPHPAPAGRVEHPERADHVHLEVAGRVGHRPHDRPGRGQVNDRVAAGHRVVQRARVADVALDQFGRHAGQVGRVAGRQVVKHPYLVAAGRQAPHQRRPDESRASGD